MRKLDILLETALQYFPAFKLSIAIDNFNSKYFGMYIPEIMELKNGEFMRYHWIQINSAKHESDAELLDSILHELIHAWQFENGIELDHGVEFCEWCLKLQTLGFNTYSTDCMSEIIKVASANLSAKSKLYFGGINAS
jgi:hypothetical protein